MKKLFYIHFFLLCNLSTIAQTQSDILFSQANIEYQQEKYTEAIDNYLKIINLGYESAELYFNLANTYYKQGKVAQSIYYYEKALQIAPFDADIQNNKKFAEQMILDKITPLPKIGIKWLKQFAIDNFSIQQVSTLAIMSAWLMAMFVVIYYLSNKTKVKKIFFASAAFLLFILAGMVIFGYFMQNTQNTHEAILFEPEAKMYSEPSLHSQEIRLLHQGTKVEIQENFSSWAKIRLANGQTGWVKQQIFKEL